MFLAPWSALAAHQNAATPGEKISPPKACSLLCAGIGISARPAGSSGKMLHHIGVPMKGGTAVFASAIPE